MTDILQNRVSRLTLRFRDPALERSFSEGQAAEARPVGRWAAGATVLVCLIVVAFPALLPFADRTGGPAELGAVSVALLALSFVPILARHIQPFFACGMFFVSVVLSRIWDGADRQLVATYGYGLMTLHILNSYSVVRLRTWWALMTGLSSTGFYLAWVSSHSGLAGSDLMHHATFLVTANIFGVMLNSVFSAFDTLAARYGLEKIKTIGDAYMVVGGLPLARADHAPAVAAMALDMRAELARIAAEHQEELQVRIGLHTGPVVAGVIGQSKFSYDLWGDTVNTASRLESHGLPGSIQCSEQTAGLLDQRFKVSPRGPVVLKGKGEISTFLIERG